MSSIGLNNIKCPNDFKIYYKSGGAVPIVSVTPSATPQVSPPVTPSVTPSISISSSPGVSSTPSISISSTPPPTPSISITPSITPSVSGCGSVDPFATGLEACWNLNEASGTLYDSTANNHDLTTTNLIGYQFPGKVDSYCINVTNNTAYARTVAETSLGLSTFSVSAWVKVAGTTANDRYVISRGFAGTAGYAIFIGATDGHPGLSIWESGSGYSPKFSGSTVNDGNWHHIVITFNGSTNYANCYVDGNPDSTNPIPMSKNPYNTNSLSLYLGSNNWSLFLGLTGYLDAVALFSKVLTYCEVLALYNSNLGLACNTPPPSPSPTPSTSSTVNVKMVNNSNSTDINSVYVNGNYVINSYVPNGFNTYYGYSDQLGPGLGTVTINFNGSHNGCVCAGQEYSETCTNAAGNTSWTFYSVDLDINPLSIIIYDGGC